MIDPNFYTTQHIELEVAELDIDEGLKDCILATLERYNKIDDALKVANQTNGKLFNKLSELQAKLAEIEKQEPEVWQYKSSFNLWKCFENEKHHKDTIADGSFEVRPLYARPVQQSPAISKMETTSQSSVTELIECIKYLMEWQVKNVDKWHNDAYDQAAKIIAKLNKQGA